MSHKTKKRTQVHWHTQKHHCVRLISFALQIHVHCRQEKIDSIGLWRTDIHPWPVPSPHAANKPALLWSPRSVEWNVPNSVREAREKPPIITSAVSTILHTKPLTYRFILFTFCAHKATYYHVMLLHKKLLSLNFFHFFYTQTIYHHSPFLHANTHKGSYCHFDFSMLIHKKPVTVVASISLCYHTQSHLPSLHFLCVFNAAQTPIMSYRFSPCFITSLHVLYTQSHSLSPRSMLFLQKNPLTITALTFHTQIHLLSLRSMFYTHKATYYHFLFFFFFVHRATKYHFLYVFAVIKYPLALCIMELCASVASLNGWTLKKRRVGGRGEKNSSKQQCTGVPWRKADPLT